MHPLPSLLVCGVIAIAPAMIGRAANADAPTLDDVGTRLQFAFYTADVAGLRRALEDLAALEVEDDLLGLRQTYSAYGNWKLAELLKGPDAPAASRAARDCALQGEAAAERTPRATLYALLSVCQRLSAELEGRVRAPLAAGRSRQALERGLALAPRDPRLLLIAGLNEYEQREATPAALGSAREQFEAAIAAFSAPFPAEGATDLYANAFDWGEAEAWVALGRVHLQQGNAVAARDALEHALVLVEDYREARQLLGQVTGTRPR